MKFSTRLRGPVPQNDPIIRAINVVAVALLLGLTIQGCTTVHQAAVESKSAGYYQAPIRDGDHYVVDEAFRDRYNALIAIYGHKKLENGAPVFLPPLEKDAGVTPGDVPHTFIMSRAAMENMVVLSDLKRRGAAP